METVIQRESDILKKSKVQPRLVVKIPDAKELYELLYDRLIVVLDGLEILEGDYTLFLNALSREKTSIFDEDSNFIYGGIKVQIKHLEKSKELKKTKDISSVWHQLDNSYIPAKSTIVTYRATSDISLARIQQDSLFNYFNGVLNEWQQLELQVIEEYLCVSEYNYISIPIIQFTHCDGIVHIIYKNTVKNQKILKKERTLKYLVKFFTIEYEGIFLDWDMTPMHDRFKIGFELRARIKDNSFWKSLEKHSLFDEIRLKYYYETHLDYINTRIEQGSKNQALYYQLYLSQSIIQILIDSYSHNISAHSLTVLSSLFNQRANDWQRYVGARHETVADLEALVNKTFKDGSTDQLDALKLLQALLPTYTVGDTAQTEPIVVATERFDKEIHTLLKFFTEKGVFWTGVTREVPAGGVVMDLFSLLWNDFLNNALYLGTIARSEGIRRINLKITFFEPEASVPLDTKYIRPKKVETQRILGSTDLTRIRMVSVKEEKDRKYILTDNGQQLKLPEDGSLDVMLERSKFTEPGDHFEELAKELKEVKVFFPGDIIGKHAFLTMLENELRNAKHYKHELLQQMQKDGLTLHLSLQSASVNKNNPTKHEELWRVGLWIDTENMFTYVDKEEETRNKSAIVSQRFQHLCEDIMTMTEDGTLMPRLGGTTQDKICAALLFNNTVGAVQRGDTGTSRDKKQDSERDMYYYPWVTPTLCKVSATDEHEKHEDVELSFEEAQRHHKDEILFISNLEDDALRDSMFSDLKKIDVRRSIDLKETITEYIKTIPNSFLYPKGYLKKYFHIWKGADFYRYNSKNKAAAPAEWENLARYKFTLVDMKEELKTARRQGIVRIIECEPKEMDLKKAYALWLQQWFGQDSQLVPFIKEKKADDGSLWYNPAGEEVLQYLSPTASPTESVRHSTLEIIHSDKDAGQAAYRTSEVINYRNHGILKSYYTNDDKRDQKASIAHLNIGRLPEFYETLLTRVCIFDNRIYNRLKIEKEIDFYRNNLALLVCPEITLFKHNVQSEKNYWKKAKEDFIPTCHFLVMHLSFIEQILKDNYTETPNYDNVGFFFKKELDELVRDKNSTTGTPSIRKNFLLVITTGRGRMEWWDRIKDEKSEYNEYAAHILFRPVEALISAVETAVSMGDDVELKHRIAKVLFGS